MAARPVPGTHQVREPTERRKEDPLLKACPRVTPPPGPSKTARLGPRLEHPVCWPLNWLRRV
jgi:hypothetical protein